MKRQWLDRRIAAPGPFLALCLTEDQLVSACRDLKVKPPGYFIRNDHSHATVHHYDSPFGLACIVCVRGYDEHTPVEMAGLLVHEAVHIWQEYADHIGERNPGREQEAYAIQAIAQELMAEFARQVA
ncbi:MAG TPA: hypothetical protein VIN03_12040 [Roseateles sp.]